jgi:hypothetical protein
VYRVGWIGSSAKNIGIAQRATLPNPITSTRPSNVTGR